MSLFQVSMDTDGEVVEIQMLNDYTASKVKDEMSDYEAKGVLQGLILQNIFYVNESNLYQEPVS